MENIINETHCVDYISGQYVILVYEDWMDELRLTLSQNSHSHRFETEPSEQALWADYNNGAGWKNLALQGVENRWIEFGKFVEQQKVYAIAETLREQLGNVSRQNPSECLGLLIMHGDIPLRKQPFLPQPPC